MQASKGEGGGCSKVYENILGDGGEWSGQRALTFIQNFLMIVI